MAQLLLGSSIWAALYFRIQASPMEKADPRVPPLIQSRTGTRSFSGPGHTVPTISLPTGRHLCARVLSAESEIGGAGPISNGSSSTISSPGLTVFGMLPPVMST
jgi:hypothetical protein